MVETRPRCPQIGDTTGRGKHGRFKCSSGSRGALGEATEVTAATLCQRRSVVRWNMSGFIFDGRKRLLKSPGFRQEKEAIEAEVRAARRAELDAALDLGRRSHIDNEIEERVKSIMPSPYSLWSSQR